MRWILLTALLALSMVACNSDNGGTSPTASRAQTDTATPGSSATQEPLPVTESPTATAAFNARELVRGDDAPFPQDLALIVETGCWGCAGGPGSLVRIYGDPSGSVRSETILDPGAYGGISPSTGVPFNGLAMSPDGSTMAVAICVKGSCGAGGITDWDPESEAVVLRSSDGGITWIELTRGGPALGVVGLDADGSVLTVKYLEPLGGTEYRLYPEDQIVERPPDAADIFPPFAAVGQTLWRGPNGQLSMLDGTAFVLPSEIVLSGVWRAHIGQPDGFADGEALVTWDASSRWYFGLFDIDNGTELRQAYYISNESTLGWWSEAQSLAVITVGVPPPPEHLGVPIPALVDLTTGEYRLLMDTFHNSEQPYQPFGRSRVDAVQQGPFARVINTGSCLNVRSEPATAAQVLNCAADGVLLQDSGEALEAEGATWVRVRTPAGVEGWAAAEFLER